MVKRSFGIFLLFVTFSAGSQNIQLHYDLGKFRHYLTSTVEMFRTDKCGNTFFFIDMDYNSVPDKKGITMAYWEIARAFRIPDSRYAFHTEYNGGFGQWSEGGLNGTYQIENAFLNGIEMSWDDPDFTKGLTIQLLHKYIQGKHRFSFQLTGVWYLSLAGNKISFTGFADFWREDLIFGDTVTKYCLNMEPQIWYNLNKTFSVGGEVELDSNFGGLKGFHCMPTIGVKYTL